MENKLDITTVIQEFIDTKGSGARNVTEKCMLAVEAYQTIKWKKYYRIVAIIRKRTEYAILIFTATRLVNSKIYDVKLKDVLPFNVNFKITPDETRFPNGDYRSVIMTGEDFTISDLDPLVEPIKSINNEQSVSGRKLFNFDIHKDDEDNLRQHITKLAEFATAEESFSSFDWISKLRDENDSPSESVTDTTSTVDSEHENRVRSASSSPRPGHLIKQDENEEMTMSSIFPPSYPNTNKPTSSMQLLNVAVRTANPYTQQSSMGDLNNQTSQLVPAAPDRIGGDLLRKNKNKNQSTPDLLDGFTGSTRGSPSRFSFYNTMNGDSQNAYIEQKLKQKEEDYCNWEDHLMFVGSWNVNGMRVEDGFNIDAWLKPPDNMPLPSFYIIGFQELDLSVSGVALNRGTSNMLEEKWLRVIESSSPFRAGRYKRLYRSRLAGILLVVYVDQKLSKNVPDKEVLFNKVPTGVFNMMGNKGGVGIRLQAFNSNLVFINCHLAAGENNRQRRDQDFREVEKNMVFSDDDNRFSGLYDNNDLVFLMGDLNYRLSNIEAVNARELAMRNRVDMLLERDELTTVSKSVFKRFHEGKIEFLPTYKFEINRDDYDTSEKNRVPSYCDRIMWYGERCQQLKYNSIMDYKTSDHRPIYSWFKIGLKKVDRHKRLKVQEGIIRNVDLMYNLSLPQAKVDRQEIHFEGIHFYEHRQASITVTNTGQYEFLFRFKEIPGSPRIPDWLTVQPSEGHINPNENKELIFEIFVNASNVSSLNTRSEVQCILVLDLQGGKDYFITVSAELVPTSFGLPLSLLTTLERPVASLTRSELTDLCKVHIQRPVISTSVSTCTSYDAFTTPKEIFVMIDFLNNSITEEELFARPGSHPEIQNIREQLDTRGSKADFSSYSVHSVIEALFIFLNSFYFPIIPNNLIRECIGVHGNFEESVKVIAKLPPDHQNLFHYLTSFLRKVLEHKSKNGTDIASLAILFVDLIFRPQSMECTERETCATFIRQFLSRDPANYFRALSNPGSGQ